MSLDALAVRLAKRDLFSAYNEAAMKEVARRRRPPLDALSNDERGVIAKRVLGDVKPDRRLFRATLPDTGRSYTVSCRREGDRWFTMFIPGGVIAPSQKTTDEKVLKARRRIDSDQELPLRAQLDLGDQILALIAPGYPDVNIALAEDLT